MFITRQALPRRTFLRGLGTAVALPFLDAMTPALARAQSRKAPVRMAFVYVPNGIDMRHWNPAYEGRARRAAADAGAARAAQGRHPAARQPDAQHRPGAARRPRRPRPLLRLVSHRRPGEEDGHRHQGQRVVRSAGGEPDRQADALPVARSRTRGRPPGGRLRFRLLVRLHQQSGVAQRDAAAAADSRSARAVRAAVRRRRRADARGAGAPPTPPPQHPRLHHRRHAIAARSARPDRSAQARRVPRLDSRDRGAAGARRAGERRSIRAWRSRTACPAISPSTSS